MLKTFAILFVAFTTACVADEAPPEDIGLDRTGPVIALEEPELENDDVAPDPRASVTAGVPAAPEAERNICELLPSGGPCARACEPDAMIAEHVPAGSCAWFSCELSDGSIFRTGGCN